MTTTAAAALSLAALEAAVSAALTTPAVPPMTTAAPAVPPTTASNEQPALIPAQVEAAPSVMEVITTVVEEVLTGNHKSTVDKRRRLIADLAQGLADLPVYGIELDNARVPIGDTIELGNAVIEVDGCGYAARITVDRGTPILDPA